ncbi:MAG: Gfo/Idh/MocA family oxidoreductase [Acidobacteria bacterium]|nr:Gfo/Idh/MocA family oxidoreductase [Acidobacteriota bacterium]
MTLDSRRFFFFGALAAPVLQRLQGQNTPDTIGAAIIGAGGRGSLLLRQAMAQPGVKIVALCDLKPDRLDKAASAASRDNPATFTDYHRLLERRDVQAVYIASPCDLHVEMAIAALKAGKHVYCEKPVGITPDSIARLLQVARQSNTVFQVGQQMRSSGRLRETIAKIHQGVAGKIVMIKAQRHAADDLAHDGTSADWFFNASRSGDVIVEMSVHNLDLFNWVVNEPPARAAGFGGTLIYVNEPPGRTNMDGYTLSYEYPGGVKLSYTQVFFHPRGLPGGAQSTYVYGTEGAVDLSESVFYPKGRGAKPVVLAEARKEDVNERHSSDFFEAIRSGKRPFADITVGATGALTAILGREAIYQRKVMEWRALNVRI